ncbi:MAG TPA: arginine N-succinyltransferase [Aromatoleum sp.]|uniref:arginine N-succinyltransferase n=1 Tax=Aromatoleum sp. TaxID=2307007 RepID=UPI002B487D11|nr:arginine N-succinyltransferase [Aromatoleum sp.]HJV27356.1 arginine N-succinyltransferase [Aromatoleum sp.]
MRDKADKEFVVRLATMDDAEAFTALVVDANGTLERHPESVDASRATIAVTRRSLAGEATDAERSYLLLLEEVASGEVVGCIALTCNIGLDQPFYDYRLGKMVHSSRRLKSYRCLDVLYLCNDLTGCSEIHSLYVRRDARRMGAAAQLVRAAQLFVASRPAEFAPRIIGELRGVQDGQGTSPFWQAVGRHFFKVDQRGAERLVAKGHKAFIAELMPKYPVYLSLLPEAAQCVVGGVHESGHALAALLENDGFHFENHVDIFDAGRVMEAHTTKLNGVANSLRLTAAEASLGSGAGQWWIAAGEGADFRATLASGMREAHRLLLPAGILQRVRAAGGTVLRALCAG